MDLPIVASLWIGGTLSFIEQVCLKSFVDHGHRTILYTYGDVGGVPEGVEVLDAARIFPSDSYIRHARTGSPAVHADAFRYRMLEVQNVIWVDADILCMRPWDFSGQWVFGWEHAGRQVCNAVLGVPRFSKTLAKLNRFCRDEYPVPPWADAEEVARLEAAKAAGKPVHVSELQWGVWGPSALTHFLHETGEISHALPEMAFYPIPFKDRRQLLKPGRMIDKRLGDGCYGVHLWNRRLRRRILMHDGGSVDPESFLGRALTRHGIDPDKARIEDDMAAQQAEAAEVLAVTETVSETVSDSGPETRLDTGSVMMERRAIDPALPVVASLWIGGSLSFLEQVCLKSFRDFGHRTVLYTYGDVGGVPEGIETRDANTVFPNQNYIRHGKSGSPAVHADAFRYRMIDGTDVIWVDADILCTQPWKFDTPWVFGWEKSGKLVCNAVLGLPKSSKTLAALNELCATEYPIPPWAKPEEKARLEAARDAGDPVHVTELKWGVWGPAAVSHFLKETGEIEHALPQEAFYPVSFRDRRDFLMPGKDLSDRIGAGTYGVHLWNRRIRRRIITHENGVPQPDCYLGQALTRHRVDPLAAPIPDEPPAHIVAERKRGDVAEPAPAPAPQDRRPRNSNNPNVTIQPPAAMAGMPLMRLQQTPEAQNAIDNLEGRTGEITGWLKPPDAPVNNDKILIVTSMKNEAPFILEWVAYHKSIGVDHFLVYTNDCTDNTNEMLDRLDALGHATRLDNPWDPASGKKPQHMALKDAVKQPCYKDADWVLTIDVDEFVNIHVGSGKFDDLFKASNSPNVISFTWKFFGNKGIENYEDRPITEQFTACAPEFIPKPRLGWGFKSMFHKSSPYARIGVHRPLGIHDADVDQVRWVNGSGRAMPDMLLTNNGWRSTKRSLGYRLATLNHYILRSAESFLVKRERGRINHTEHDQGIDYWTRRNYATETDTRIHARRPGMQAILDEFHCDNALKSLHKEAVMWHRARIAALLEKPDYRQLFDELVQPGRPDALAISKEAEAKEAEAKEAADSDRPETAGVGASLRPAEALTNLRMVSAPASAAAEPVHERFDDARKHAQQINGFFWEGPENALMFVPKSKRLVVTFDNISIAREEGQRWPWGHKVLSDGMGASVLGVMAVQRNWFRQEFVHDAFEALRDQGFFEQFDEILFYGASMGGFAALVYQQCAPGANVLAIAPQSTLSRRILPNEDRWGWTKKLDWDGRFNDAAGVTAGAGEVFIVADPYYKPDFDQVSRITGDNVTWLHTPFMGHQLPNAFVVMGILKELLYSAAGGTLTPQQFYRLFRARNDLPRFQHDLLMEAEKRGKIRSAIRICEYTLKKRKAGNIKRTLDRLLEEVGEGEQKEAAE